MDSSASSESLALLAADPATPAATLTELAKRPELGALLAANPNTPLAALARLAVAHAGAVLANPALPLHFLEQPDLLQRLPQDTLHAFLRQAALPAWMAAQLVAHAQAASAAAARWHCALVGDLDLDWDEAIAGMLWSARLTWNDEYLNLLLARDMIPRWLFPALLGAEDARGRSHAALRRAAARSPACPPEMLRALRQVGADIDGTGAPEPDPAIDQRWLERFAQGPHWLCRLALRHPAAPPALLERFASHAHRDMRQAVAKHPATPPALLARLASDHHPHVVQAVARRPDTPPATLAALLAQGACGARVALAANPALSANQLGRLARDGEWPVRKAVAANPATPPDLLAALADDANHGVYLAAAANPATPPAALERLAGHANPHARAVAAARLRGEAPPAAQPRRRDRIAPAIPPAAGGASEPPPAAPPALTPEEFARHAAHPNSRIRLIAASHPGAAPELLRALAADSQLTVRHAVARNPATPPDVLAWLADARDGTQYQYARSVSHNPGASDALFAQVIERLEPWEVVRNPRLGPERQIAWLWRLFADFMGRGWDGAGFIAALLAHPQCPPARLKRALASPHWIHHYAVAQNPAAPAPLLELLAEDANQLIRFAARKALAARQPNPGVPPLGSAQPPGAEP